MIFITGMFRSGTTLLSRMLHAHNNITIAYDIYLPFFQSLRIKIANDLKIDINGKYSDIDKYFYPVNEYYFSEEEITLFKKIQSTDLNHPISNSELNNLRSMIHAYGERFEPKIVKYLYRLKGTSYKNIYLSMMSLIEKGHDINHGLVGFKDAWADEFIPSLIRTFPNIKIIQILRDPRAICASKNYSDRTKPYPLIFITRRWRKHALLFKHYEKEYVNNLISIKYENLVTNSEEVINSICKFINIEFDERMLKTEYFKNGNGNKWFQNSSFPVNKKGINSLSVNKWKEVLESREIEFIEKMCYPEMLLNGYSMHINSDKTKLMIPPIIPKCQLSEWVRSYTPLNKIDTEIEMKKELYCNKIFINKSIKADKFLENYFLLPELYLSYSDS